MHLVRNNASTELTEDPERFVAGVLQQPLRALATDYVEQWRMWAQNVPRCAVDVQPKEFQARHAALKTALSHIELLLKLTRTLEAGAGEADEEGLEAEAARNLARPA